MRLVVALATTVSMSAATAAEPAELYQLQLRCGKKRRRGFCKGLRQRNGRRILFQLPSSLQRPSEQVFLLTNIDVQRKGQRDPVVLSIWSL